MRKFRATRQVFAYIVSATEIETGGNPLPFKPTLPDLPGRIVTTTREHTCHFSSASYRLRAERKRHVERRKKKKIETLKPVWPRGCCRMTHQRNGEALYVCRFLRCVTRERDFLFLTHRKHILEVSLKFCDVARWECCNCEIKIRALSSDN